MKPKFHSTILAMASLFIFCGDVYASTGNRFLRTDIEKLMNEEVTSVSKSPQSLQKTAAAIYVITQEDIRRSGARTIPDLLRTVPGLQVAQVNSNRWAVSSRGFNNILSNKLLVLIDGRSVYNPLHRGVYWDTQDTLLSDIERIEVIRGPGASVWGSNAVNGVINIITKSAKDTVGGLAEAGAGNQERHFESFRYGAKVNEELYYRFFTKYFDRDANFNGNDSWNMSHSGFRADWDKGENQTTFQGDVYTGQADLLSTQQLPLAPFRQRLLEDETLNGGNLIYRWHHTEDEQRSSTFQAYFDQNRRDQTIFEENRWTGDLDWQMRFPGFEGHQMTVGAGYRLKADETNGSFATSFDPTAQINQLFHGLVQDEISLTDDLILTLGSKLEHNDYSGFEIQPTARVAWSMTPEQTLWTAVSRAVRIPTRIDNDLVLNSWQVPGVALARVYGDSTTSSEALVAYEAGYRQQISNDLSADASVFFNDYNNILTVRTSRDVFAEGGVLVTPFYLDDQIRAETYGFELSTAYEVTQTWKLQAGYSFLKMQLHAAPDSIASSENAERQSPNNQIQLRSYYDFAKGWEWDSQLRYVDSLAAFGVGSYVELDMRLAWHPSENWEISLVGRNLIEEHHREFSSAADPDTAQVERSVYGKVSWWF